MRHFIPWVLLSACHGGHQHSATETGDVEQLREVSTASFLVSYAPDPDPIPLNDYFSMTLTVQDLAGDPVTDAQLGLDAVMPSHGHGMNVVPTLSDEGNGSWLAEGMLFHMEGVWVLTADITRAGSTETAEFNVVMGSL